MHTRRAVTLIELLVVLSIVALLFAISLPGLSASRNNARRDKSLANLRSIGQANGYYGADFKGSVPILWLGPAGGPQGGRTATGFCGWSAWGAWCQGNYAQTVFDAYPMHRPLNPYLFSSIRMPPAPSSPPPTGSTLRSNLSMLGVKDPSDRIGHQRDWPDPNTSGLSCYEDVGTSYLWTSKWFDFLTEQRPELGFTARLRLGLQNIGLASTFIPSRFVWAGDESFEVVSGSPDGGFTLKNGYGDRNRGAALFLDGHSAFYPVVPGTGEDAYRNENYSLIFDTDHPPR